MHSPTLLHFTAVKRILPYVKGTLHQGLWFRPGKMELSAFSDSDRAGDAVDRRSTTGFLCFSWLQPISWSAKKQGTVAQSSTEADYRALALTVVDLSWITQLLTQLRVSVPRPLSLWCDSLSAIALAHNPVFHARTKHIEIDYHFLHDKVV